MSRSLLHPALAQTLRAAVRRIGQWAVPDDEAPTLMLGSGPACRGDSCKQGRTPATCYQPAKHEPDAINDLANAIALWLSAVIVVVVSTALICGVL